MICKKCGNILPQDSVYCPICGAEVEKGAAGGREGEGICPVCGGRYQADDMFCPTCGNDLSKENKPVSGGNRAAVRPSGTRLVIAAVAVVCILIGAAIAGTTFVVLSDSSDESASASEDQIQRVSGNIQQETEEESVGSEDMENDSTVRADEEDLKADDEKNETGIHQYEFVIEDCGWNQAYRESLQRGGYLVRINSREEYDHLLGLINQRGYDKIHFYIGGRKADNSGSYYWVDENNDTYGEALNGNPDVWCSGEWMAGEPSYTDPNLGIEETYLNIFYYSGENRWVFNDGPENIPDVVPAFAGVTGYIIEYEE